LVDEDQWGSAGDGYIDSVSQRLGYNEERHEAHEFARAFLMPEKDFRRVSADNYDGRYYDITSIAAHFDVPVSAAKTRGRWLGLFSSGQGVWLQKNPGSSQKQDCSFSIFG
jgi:Zn-dependent peptidase ImmA (M78 family)